MNKQLEEVLEVMERVLKNDLCIKWCTDNLDTTKKYTKFNDKENFIEISIYHVPDFDNVEYCLYKNKIRKTESCAATKIKNELAENFLKGVAEYLCTPNASWLKIEKILDFYESKFNALYKAKYRGDDYYNLIAELE